MNKSYDTKLTLGTDGIPTAVAEATETNILSGALTHVMNTLTLSKDKVVVGPAAILGNVVVAGIGGYAARWRLGLQFNANPWASQ